MRVRGVTDKHTLLTKTLRHNSTTDRQKKGNRKNEVRCIEEQLFKKSYL